MSVKAVSGMMLTLLLIGMLAFSIQPSKASGTVYIRADGSVEPYTTPISTVDNITYTFTDNICDEIVVERSNIIINGNGHTLEGNGNGKGFSLTGMSNVEVRNVKIRNFCHGIYTVSSSNITISGNTVTTKVVCIWLKHSDNITISKNQMANGATGIDLSLASNNRISENKITNNVECGIILHQGSNNNKIVENDISGNPIGIRLDSNRNNNISRNNVMNNYVGIDLTDSNYNIVSENSVIASSSSGMTLFSYSSHNGVFGNIIAANEESGISVGVSINNTFIGNDITNNSRGIRLGFVSYSTVSQNNIVNNNIGVELYESSDNLLFHNNLIKNVKQVHSNKSINAFDSGYPSGGNYWSDYTNVDSYSGPYQNETGRDGIWDHPYVIDENNQDNYPLARVDFSLVDVDGNEFSLSDYRGKVVLLDFFATWCHPSVEEISHLKVLHEEFGENLVIISISPEDEEALRDFRNEYGIEWTIAKDTAGVFGIYNVQFLPTLVIIEQHGYICYRHVGLTEASVLRSEIESLLPSKTLLGTGWGWMRIAPREYVYGRAELYRVGDTQIELVITREGDEYSRRWNIIFHKEFKYGEGYLCYSDEWGFLMVGFHRHRRWQFWYAVGRGVVAFGFPRFGRLSLTPI